MSLAFKDKRKTLQSPIWMASGDFAIKFRSPDTVGKLATGAVVEELGSVEEKVLTDWPADDWQVKDAVGNWPMSFAFDLKLETFRAKRMERCRKVKVKDAVFSFFMANRNEIICNHRRREELVATNRKRTG